MILYFRNIDLTSNHKLGNHDRRRPLKLSVLGSVKKELGQILVTTISNISNSFLVYCEEWKLVPSLLRFWLNSSIMQSSSFYEMIFTVSDRPSAHPEIITKPKLIIVRFWLIAVGWWIRKGLDLGSSPSKNAKLS